jgi:hypothetical protein
MWMLHMTVLKVNVKNIEWGRCLWKCYLSLFSKWYEKRVRCLCECYIWLFSKWIWKTLSEVGVYVNLTHDCSQSECEKYWVRLMFMKMLHITDLKVNMKNIEWGRCLCECYTWLFSKWMWKTLSEVDVYVNVTYDCSQSEYEKHWVR